MSNTVGRMATEAAIEPRRPCRAAQKAATSLTDPVSGGRVDGKGRRIPMPREPVEPVLDAHSLFGVFRRPDPSIMDVGKPVYPRAGRHAIALALETAGVGPGSHVLIPAYHCDAMVEPVLWVGAEPVFFRLREDLSVDLDDVERKATAPARAMLAVHYFGFVQDFCSVRDFCSARGIALIEDCAHCFFGTDAGGRPVGSVGDYAIGSFRKFFPVTEGACLTSVSRDLSHIRLASTGLSSALRALYGAVDAATSYGRLSAIAPAIDAIERQRARRRDPTPPATPTGSGPVTGDDGKAPTVSIFDESQSHTATPDAARLLFAWTRHEDSATIRRRNFDLLRDGLADIPGSRMLPVAGQTSAPYLFPLWVDDLRASFARLEDAALPMQRFGQFPWPGMDRTVDPFSAALSDHVVQFACHQSLGPDDMTAMIDRIRGILTGSPTGRGIGTS